MQPVRPPPTPKAPEILQTTVHVEDVKGCNRCAMETRVHVRDNPGVRKVHIDIKTGNVSVIHLSDQLTTTVLKQSLEDRGHTVEVLESVAWEPPAEPEPKTEPAEPAPTSQPAESPAAESPTDGAPE